MKHKIKHDFIDVNDKTVEVGKGYIYVDEDESTNVVLMEADIDEYAFGIRLKREDGSNFWTGGNLMGFKFNDWLLTEV